MARFFILLLVAGCATGCRFHTTIYAPGATGRIIDAVTHQPVAGARITRPATKGSKYSLSGADRPPEGLPASTAMSNQRGDFNLPPAAKTRFDFMFSPNPHSLTGPFLVTADGYATNELSGIGSARISWRAELGDILLHRPQVAQTNVVFDDLEWLVGKWQCVSNQSSGNFPRFSNGPEKLEMINVFYPFDSELTLALSNTPHRQITAEFLVAGNGGKYLPMATDIPSVITIGIDKIIVGYSIAFTYRHTFDEDAGVNFLELSWQSPQASVRLLFKKTADCPGKAESLYGVNHQQTWFQYLRHQYDRLKFGQLNEINLRRGR